ncbi:zinc-dependent metalloprotease [Corynebacterium uropygiale]|uniref:Zinc-dependent metalloprotease n=1 Tax=Corynebacterium uropygiale TaxID=1775911 RepID=A0A9X1QMN5_9CORY|nr:zinc-dependent metalloprotease [Corynebacterium uropygiale]MCF4006099.1 zinc-dependent metalloprotease [Corynebacterium uropygiale]
MSTHGFGFSFGNNDDDDDRENRDNQNQNPFGAFGFSGGGSGGLGDILNQFGHMLSGMGASLNSQKEGEPVNYDMAERIARQQTEHSPSVSPQQRAAVIDSVRLAELWLDDVTELPTAEGSVEAWNASDYLSRTLPMWKRMVTPVAKNMNEAQLASLPEEAREMMGPMLSMMNHMSGMSFGVQLGHALGELSTQALTGSDFGLPVAPTGVTAILPEHIDQIGKDLGINSRDVMVYISAREAARQRLFRHVPWLVERLVSSVEEYANGLVIDTSHIEEAARGLNIESGDPAQIQEAMQNLQNMDLSPTITSRNAAAAARLETLLALVEGWVEFVVTQAMGERIPATGALNEAWRRRRATGGSAEKAFARVVGIELNAPKVAEALELWRRVEVAVGTTKRDAVWEHPDFMPSAEDLDNSAEFIDGLLGEADGEDFDPISEIERLQREEAEKKESEGDSGDTPDEQGKEGDNS